jgi:DNA-binding GntR family transcriptional regulator
VVDSLMAIDGRPVMILTSYLADPVARRDVADVLRPGLWQGDWYEVLSAVDLAPRRRDVLAEAVGADELVAPHLQIAVGAPVMRFERQLVLGPRRVPEYGFSYCRGDTLAFAMTDRSGPAAAP